MVTRPALVELGASSEAVDWTKAFLYDRYMSVKIGGARSDPRLVPGGSPQGSILGGFLFCCTTNCFAELPSPEIDDQEEGGEQEEETREEPVTQVAEVGQAPHANPFQDVVNSTPTARGQFVRFRPPVGLGDLEADLESDEDGEFEYFKPRRYNPLDTTIESEVGEQELVRLPSTVCREPIECYVYIDDFNTVEKLDLAGAERHITTEKQEILVRAYKSEVQFSRVGELADQIGMRVNSKKTQILCIHHSKYSKVRSYIRTEGEDIMSGDSLKILGF